MTQDFKDLLLKDLSARLPYGVKVNNEIQGNFEVYGISENIIFARTEVSHVDFPVETIKPYLFPLSSMTEEQKEEYNSLCEVCTNDWGNDMYFDTIDSIDWLLKNHFDIRGLIPIGLALDATGLNIY